MYTLYYSPGACSMAVHAVLHELGQQMELKPAKNGDQKNPEFLKVNPRGMVPTIVDDGHVMREGGAILTYLADKHSKLLPKSGKERATALEWLMFANSTLHPAYGKVFGLMKAPLSSKEADDEMSKRNIEAINTLWQDVDAQLAKNKYIAGNEITVADFLITVIANWLQTANLGINIGENTKRLAKEISSRTSFQDALKMEAVEYKAAA